jgi:Flp pilus assembly protein TadD
MDRDASAGPGSVDAHIPLVGLMERYEAVLNRLISSDPPGDTLVYELLLVRDQLAAAAGAGGSPPQCLTEGICALDEQLKTHSDRIVLHGQTSLEQLRDVVRPPDRNWWWHSENPSNPLWTIFAVLFLTVSVTMITDFTRRMLSADPDELGILSIAVQALFAVGATSTFTEGGRKWIENLLSRLGVRPKFQPRWKLVSTLALLVIVSLAWKVGPPRLAMRYNNHAYGSEETRPATALQFYQRAIALNPEMPEAHFNLGEFYEKKYEYDQAAVEYRKTIIVSPFHVKAYANLSRVLLLENQPLTALRVADHASNLPSDAQTAATLRKDLAWAEYELGFYSEAEADAKRAARYPDIAASANCVLGKIYTRWRKPADAERAWKSFKASIRDPNVHPPMVEPDCTRLAEAASHEIK